MHKSAVTFAGALQGAEDMRGDIGLRFDFETSQ